MQQFEARVSSVQSSGPTTAPSISALDAILERQRRLDEEIVKRVSAADRAPALSRKRSALEISAEEDAIQAFLAAGDVKHKSKSSAMQASASDAGLEARALKRFHATDEGDDDDVQRPPALAPSSQTSSAKPLGLYQRSMLGFGGQKPAAAHQQPFQKEQRQFEEKQAQRAREREEAMAAQEAREAALAASRKKRSQTTKALSQRSRSGQPVMANVLDQLLAKIHKSA